MVDESAEKKMTEFDKLVASGKYGRVIVKLPRFLKKRGITDRSVLAGDGWMKVFVNMVPSEFKTVEDLVQAIKDA